MIGSNLINAVVAAFQASHVEGPGEVFHLTADQQVWVDGNCTFDATKLADHLQREVIDPLEDSLLNQKQTVADIAEIAREATAENAALKARVAELEADKAVAISGMLNATMMANIGRQPLEIAPAPISPDTIVMKGGQS